MDTPTDVPNPDDSTPPDAAEENLEQPVTAQPPLDDELPEWEELTPELVEDEAIRGDFVMRWAVILMAFMFGCIEISQTEALVHIKTGQHLLQNGFLPPDTDVFSYTAEDRPWINLSWLFDLALGGAFAAGAGLGVWLFKAILAGVTFWIAVNTSRPDLPTWWSAWCGAVALLASYSLFTALPEIVTLLGLALTLSILHRGIHAKNARALWALPVVIAVWSNLDPRMFLGLFVIILYALGAQLGTVLGRNRTPKIGMGQLWTVVAACLGASLLNPFGYHAAAAPLALYGVEYPALRDYLRVNPSGTSLLVFPITSGHIWSNLNHQFMAGFLMLVVAPITFLMNWSKLDFGHVAVYAGMLVVAMLATHELAAAAIVCTILATLNGQDWYASNCRLEYSVETAELWFSRGGRALTVLGFLVVAFLGVSGRLDGADVNRIGLGFDFELESNIAGMESAFAESFDDRPFHFLPTQGDVLIWIGKKSFVDSRIALFSGGDEDLTDLHNVTRHAIRRARNLPRQRNQPAMGQPDVWKETLDRFNVTQAAPRLMGQFPDYITFFDLLSSPDWALTKVNGVTAVFCRTDIKSEELTTYLDTNRVDFRKKSFMTEVKSVKAPLDWAQPPSVYDKYLTKRQQTVPNQVREALHYLQMNETLQGIRTGTISASMERAAFAHLAVRAAMEGLREVPDCAEGYRVLGHAYSQLAILEQQFFAAGQLAGPNLLRYFQSISAFGQAVIIDPEAPGTYYDLYRAYRGLTELSRQTGVNFRKDDLALRALNKFAELRLAQAQFDEETREQFDQQIFLWQQELQGHIDAAMQVLDQAREQESSGPLELANLAYQVGLIQEAKKILEANRDLVNRNLAAQEFLARVLLEDGQPQAAYEVVQRLRAAADNMARQGVPTQSQWRSTAAAAHLANGEYLEAVQLWLSAIKEQRENALRSAFRTFPFVGSANNWPMGHLQVVAQYLQIMPSISGEMQLNVARCYMEMGRNQDAARMLKEILENDPDTRRRPLITFYLFQISDELIDQIPPSDQIPIDDIFATDTTPARPDE